MARTSEKAFNGLLAQALGRRHPRWAANAEQTGVIAGSAGKAPDIVVVPFGGSGAVPVVIETEYEPGRTVAADAEARLGAVLSASGRLLEQVVALIAPDRLRRVPQADLPAEIEQASYKWRLATGHGGGVSWFPEDGWATGSLDDLAGVCELVTVSELEVGRAADDMERTVDTVSANLTREAAQTPWVLEDIAESLCLKPSDQTTKIGVTLLANALLFQLAVEGDENPATGWRVPGPDPSRTRQQVQDDWSKILDINYLPIFYTANAVLGEIPQALAQSEVLPPLIEMAQRLAGQGAASTSDMAGQMFGKLITDRKLLATFYTRRESARLLAELAVARLPVDDWSDQREVENLRVADLACGTGALLAAAYDRIASRVRRAGGDDARLHPAMMEKVMVGADIMPAAAHMTCTSLSSMHPRSRYARSAIALMRFGLTPGTAPVGDRIRIGSLEMLDPEYQQGSWLETAELAVTPSQAGSNRAHKVLEHKSADLVIMNPPFVSPTNHADHARQGVAIPSFAGLGVDPEDQEHMSKRLAKITPRKGSAGDSNAGLGSNFLDLAHAKVKPGGVIAFVLPQTVISGNGWTKARELLTGHYKDICVVSLTPGRAQASAFSADTAIAEVLIVATRRRSNEPVEDRVLWVSLRNRPRTPLEAVHVARQIAGTEAGESSAAGELRIGGERAGSFAVTSMRTGAGYAGLTELGLGACGESMANGRLWLPRLRQIEGISITRLGELGERGPVHRDINGYEGEPGKSPPRGPFNTKKTADWRAAEYPMLWAHSAARETRLVVEPDTQGTIRPGMEELADQKWATRSRLHFTLDFTLTSQPLAACFTPEPCIGGRAWPTFTLLDHRWETAVLLWANTTMGLVAFWWVGSRQQRGRAILTITRLPELPVLDPRRLNSAQADRAREIFEEFQTCEFLPANEAYDDDARIALDEAVLIGMLGLGEDVSGKDEIKASLKVLREQWCREPSVHGGKSTRPQP